MDAPQEVLDEEHEQTVARVAAVDVAKATGMVCTRIPHETKPGRRLTKVWNVAATTNSITELADHLACQGIERVVLEATGDYWRPFFYLLEARGLAVWLVNARDVKQVPGRPKTDKLDAVWLAKLAERGMLRPSFVPPEAVRRLRDFTRLSVDLTADRSRVRQRMEKLLEKALIKLSSVATDIFGVSGRAMIEALVGGERDPHRLAALAKGRMRVKQAALVEALTGRFEAHHAYLAQMLLDQHDALTAQLAELATRIEEALAAVPAAPPPAVDGSAGPGCDPDTGEITAATAATAAALSAPARLDEIPGISARAAHIILAEIGVDMTQFPTAAHLVAWAKLCPRTIQSGAKNRKGGTGRGNPYLKGVLGEVAAAAAKTDTFLGARYRRLVKRCGKRKALVAVARSILVIIWNLLADPHARYHDLGADYHTTRIDRDRKTRSLVRQLEALGHAVALQPAA